MKFLIDSIPEYVNIKMGSTVDLYKLERASLYILDLKTCSFGVSWETSSGRKLHSLQTQRNQKIGTSRSAKLESESMSWHNVA